MSEQSLCLGVLGQSGSNNEIGSRGRVVNHTRKSNSVIYMEALGHVESVKLQSG